MGVYFWVKLGDSPSGANLLSLRASPEKRSVFIESDFYFGERVGWGGGGGGGWVGGWVGEGCFAAAFFFFFFESVHF